MPVSLPSRRTVVAGLAAAPLALSGTAGRAQGAPIRIGELNSYGRMAAFAGPYRNAMMLAQDEINQAGGIKALGGRPLEIIFRDDGSTPGDAVRVAEELLTRENVVFLCGTFLSNVGLAVADFANQRKVLFLATEPLTDALTMGSGNRYTFRVRPNTYMQTKMLVEAVKARGVKRWAIVAPNYEYGQSAAANFKRLMAAAVPGFEVVGEQFPALGKVDAGATVGALAQAKPDGLFNVLFGADLTAFVREGNTRGLFEKRTVASLLTGEPEYMIPLGDETPEGWVTTGYPWEQIEAPRHKAFVAAYRARFKDTPRLGSLLGYVVVQMIRDLLETAKSTDTEALIAALEGLQSDTIAGPVTMRALDHQSTLGAWVGETALDGRKGTMVKYTYEDGAKYLHPEAEVKAARRG
ncbi:ABC transporter substrate-binding protein [Methylobacterium isbiliense]|uniref:Leucine-, isoleucine-, valine-, threonine-, and alanine-binding protein n=1 Tax=Methylobacterium isbiliense TaxID=315478 RepID=A0ABQ4SDI0_9HYPH|nr:ABC transporter substrate-binding protein [Methylobacterium isbiliense]MDN3623798.1 ABC transporter substrate-binding protein [Methylobacterium isbiliense]GJE01139.1 Leucine-, isoleucine-, valine-, threonine-, and alanine-binding protein [Methylobacterium isbiliense]